MPDNEPYGAGLMDPFWLFLAPVYAIATVLIVIAAVLVVAGLYLGHLERRVRAHQRVDPVGRWLIRHAVRSGRP